MDTLRPVPKLSELKTCLDQTTTIAEQVRRQAESLRGEIKQLRDVEEEIQLVQAALRKMIDLEVSVGVEAIRQLLTEGLRSVFPDQKLWIEPEVKVSRGKVSVDLLTAYKGLDGQVVRGMARDSFGGSVATVLSVLLRVVVMERRGLRRFMLMDESLPAFDGNYVQNMGEFMRLLCEKMGMDILLVTHNPAMVEASHKAYNITKNEAGARITQIH